ncbi:hypothetical protein EJ08DRAFT_665693 [Tothia fuscella]|uniref:Uncharacterized protein n=1 Tax=Tothia fuscella TaxID=1048955 RepID=A0A9P4NG48_9PEZI|nr:hypothetical protein EJ08DRAFT_665693 [Tothia fuscella]
MFGVLHTRTEICVMAFLLGRLGDVKTRSRCMVTHAVMYTRIHPAACLITAILKVGPPEFSTVIFFWFATVQCRNMQVFVGLNNSIVFEPATVRADPGDTVEFIFAGLNHTVTSSNALLACQPDGLLNSGFIPVSAPPSAAAKAVQKRDNLFHFPGFPLFPSQPAPAPAPAPAPITPPGQRDDGASTLPSFKMLITNRLPQTLYCAQGLHCQNGMVMVINPTTRGANSLARYKTLAAQADANIAPPDVVGGYLINAPIGAVAGYQVVRADKKGQ